MQVVLLQAEVAAAFDGNGGENRNANRSSTPTRRPGHRYGRRDEDRADFELSTV